MEQQQQQSQQKNNKQLLVFVLRHGERADNAEKQEVTRMEKSYDPHLTKLGQIQAQQAGKKISKIVKEQYPEITKLKFISSPFLRCIMTAEGVGVGFQEEYQNQQKQEVNNSEEKNLKIQVILNDSVCEMLCKNWFQDNVLLNNQLISRQKDQKDDFRKKYFLRGENTEVIDNLHDPQNVPIYPETNYYKFGNRMIEGYKKIVNQEFLQENNIKDNEALVIVTHGYGVGAVLEENGLEYNHIDYTSLNGFLYKQNISQQQQEEGKQNNKKKPLVVINQFERHLQRAQQLYKKQQNQ